MSETVLMNGMVFDSREIIDDEGNVSYDHVYYSQDFADWLKTYFKNGILVPGGAVISTQFKVEQTDTNQITVSPGNIVVNGRTGYLTETSVQNLTPVSVEGNYRKDRVIVELNTNEEINSFRLFIKSSAESTEPEDPELVRDEYDKIYQMSVASITLGYDGIVSVKDERSNDLTCGISQVLIGVRLPEPVTGDSADNISYDDETTNLGAQTVQQAIEALSVKVDAAGNITALDVENLQVSSTLWQSVSDYTYSKFKATVTGITGVTEDMTADVILSVNDSDSGDLSGYCETGIESLTLFAKSKPTANITIPLVRFTKVG